MRRRCRGQDGSQCERNGAKRPVKELLTELAGVCPAPFPPIHPFTPPPTPLPCLELREGEIEGRIQVTDIKRLPHTPRPLTLPPSVAAAAAEASHCIHRAAKGNHGKGERERGKRPRGSQRKGDETSKRPTTHVQGFEIFLGFFFLHF